MHEFLNELVRKALTSMEYAGVWKNATLGTVTVFAQCNEEDHIELNL
jgi:hypothetical protein